MSLQKNWFEEWFNSPYYHQLYIDRDEAEASCFLDSLTDHLHPLPGALMLDVACGRGRHARILAARGFDVTGIDLAPDSIRYALQFANDHLHFYQHDMRMPFWINYFDYAFNFFTSFGYFATEREHRNALRSISQSLKPNGVFVMDYLNVQYAQDHLVHRSEKTIEGVHFHLVKWSDDTHFYKRIVIQDPAVKEPLEFTEKVARFSLDDFKKMFSAQDLTITEYFGDYNFKPFDIRNSERLVMFAVKARA
jgi:SAM-dependent methyltransferase